MSNIRIKWNIKGFKEIRTTPELQALVKKKVNEIAEKANSNLSEPGYEASTYANSNRARGSVAAVSYKAREDNARNNTLLRALNESKIN